MAKFSRTTAFKTSLLGVSVLLGCMLTIQFSISHRKHQPVTGSYIELRSDMDHELAQSNVLASDISKARDQLQQYEDANGNQTAMTDAMKAELSKVSEEAGLTPKTGPGIVITITDDPLLPANPKVNPTLTDTDLQFIVNSLFANGAKAMAINDQRLVTTSSIRLVGGLGDPVGVMQVNASPINPPYSISAIGDIERMEAVIKLDNFSFVFNEMQKDFVVHKAPNGITLPAYVGSLPGRYAQPEEASK